MSKASQAERRLQVSDYFDSVVSEIDFFTETKIQNSTKTPEEWWNRRRDEQIDAVRQIEQNCLSHIDKMNQDDSIVFIEYCFTIDYADMLFVVKSNRLVDIDDKHFINGALRWKSWSKEENMSWLATGLDCCYCVITEVDFGIDLNEIFMSNSPLVDLSEWISSDGFKRAKKLVISKLRETPLKVWEVQFSKYLKIGELRVKYSLGGDQSPEPFVEFIKGIMTCMDQIDMLYIDINTYKKIELDTIILIISSEHADRISVTIEYYRFDFDATPVLEELVQLKSLADKREINKRFSEDHLVIRDCKYLEDVTLQSVHPERLNKADLSCFRFLKRLKLEFFDSNKRNRVKDIVNRSLKHLRKSSNTVRSEWSFLDPIRANLESLDFDSRVPFRLSWRTFAQMTNLTELSITEFNNQKTRLELDEHKQLFADLVNLKELQIRIDQLHLFKTDWQCSLPMLEHLFLRFDGKVKLSKEECKASFNLPSLKSIYLVFHPLFQDTDFSSIISKFTQVKQLQVVFLSLENMRKCWYKEFKHLETLIYKPRCGAGSIDSCMFHGLEANLTRLHIDFENDQTLHPEGLRNLVNLKSVRFSSYSGHIPFDISDQSFFDGLYSLQKITYLSRKNIFKLNETFVYYQNLNRHVLIVVGVGAE